MTGTEQQIAERIVRCAVEAAVFRAYEQILDSMHTEVIGVEAVTRAIRDYPDFSDGWDEWRQGL